ncbi:Alpha-hemolysin translocation ATP-binding protein HlyB [Botrimarina colliarenosi]|uniref:Alpha-hemolysin translocation ATP-binding protein HlyB n=1 Tax=Botrimarina colliarenosi TaxID=2528001 RepID=A0A5C6AEV0_9BACT|nr:ATP-binding cassette domain-containing protein [Botrimarina colliarenosi]TWT97937.1 Alpha-hemolysin translocation ATP-binding protein HlyB [Botrimarina colliarenosi]
MTSTVAPPTGQILNLASALVRIGRERGVTIERLRAEQLIRDAQAAWPGEAADRWDEWLREAAICVSLPSRVADLPIDAAIELARNGALVVGRLGPVSDAAGVTLLVGVTNNSVGLATDEQGGLRQAREGELAGQASADEVHRWMIVDFLHLGDEADAHRLQRRPVRRFYQLLRPEWPDIWLILIFAFFAGVLNLATPIAVESLVNTVAFGRLLQPVVVLAAMLFGFLAFAGMMQALQTYVVEIIQRRLFARVSADLAFRLPRIEPTRNHGEYGPELVNRFLDVVTLQKVSAQLLTDGVSIVLATVVGMTVLAFYHPWLLGFDLLLLAVVITGLVVAGRGAIVSGIEESKLKYKLTAWFEDVVRCENSFKTHGGADFANDRASALTTRYLKYRRKHFGVLFRQLIFLLGLQAIAGTVLLGFGGWLVIQGQLSLGQLVAAELIVATILGSLAKLGKHLEGFYDVVAAVDKLGHLFDLPVERLDGVLALPAGEGAGVVFTDLRHANANGKLASGLNDKIIAGQRVALLGGSGSGKSTLMRMLYGLERPNAGHVEIEGTDPRDVRPDVLREQVALVSEPELFEGSIGENVHLHRPSIAASEVRAALDSVGLLDTVLRLPDGLDTEVNATGGPLSMTQQRLLMLARALASRPRLLLIDGMLDCIADSDLRLVAKTLDDPKQTFTMIVATGRAAVAERFERVIRLDDGIETGSATAGDTP